MRSPKTGQRLKADLDSLTIVGLRIETDRTVGIEKSFEKFGELDLCKNRIVLMINPKEEDHSQLINLIESAIEILSDKNSFDGERFMNISNSITIKSQEILKREWERVKKGD